MTASPANTVSVHVDAAADSLYDIVTDIAHMGRLSPECTGGAWLDGATGPAVGARFKGMNKRGFVKWSTTNTVLTADPGREFAFTTADSGVCWRYQFVPDGTGTLVTESREDVAKRGLLAKVFTALLLGGGANHEDELRAGMADTLDRLRALAESTKEA